MITFVKIIIDMETESTIMSNLHESEAKVLDIILIASKDNNLTWYSNKDSRQKIADKLKVSDIRVKQIIASLVEKNILLVKSKGTYIVSAKYFQISKER